MEKIVLKSVGVAVVFAILINASAKIFNTLDAWTGIGLGVMTIIFTYILARGIVKEIQNYTKK